MNKNLSILLFSILLSSCNNSNKLIEENDSVKAIEAIKFMDMQAYSASISESLFWEFGDLEFAKIKMNFNTKSFYDEVLSFKSIDNGLSEDFDYAFLLHINQSIDTIYASLATNKWTVKKNGEFLYFHDEKAQLKLGLQEYSTFFSDCW